MYFSEINSEREVMAVVVAVVVVTCLFVYFKGWRRREEKRLNNSTWLGPDGSFSPGHDSTNQTDL